jgi:hypothetical protein
MCCVSCDNISKFYGDFRRLGPRSTPKEMALPSELSEAIKAAAIEKINALVDFADLIIERLSQLNYAIVLFVGLCGLMVVAVRSRRRFSVNSGDLGSSCHRAWV